MQKKLATPMEPKGNLEVTVGAVFRARREAARVTQPELARAIGRCVNTIRWHEAGIRMLRATDIMRAADVFGCPPGDLLPPPGAA